MHDRRRNQPPLPKPYDFVPLTNPRVTNQIAGHHRYQPDTLSGTLTATIVARSPIHVASGLLEQNPGNRQYPLVKAHVRTGGRLAIPGTSLKGCIRSIVEAITHSSVSQTTAHIPGRYRPRRNQPADMDPAERIFGTLGYQGLISFADALLEQGRIEIVPAPQLFRPRPESTETYFDGKQPRGRKFYMHGNLARGNLPLEACATDSAFRLQCRFTNLTPAELGVILVALGLGDPRFCPKLGGGKPACLGTIEIRDPAISYDDPRARYTGIDQTTPGPAISELVQAAGNLISQPQLQRLADILRYPRPDRNCPDRSY